MSQIAVDPRINIPQAVIPNFRPIRERLNCPWDANLSQEQNIRNVRNKLKQIIKEERQNK